MIRVYRASKSQLKHREISDEIKKKIDNGEQKEGKTIPTERELVEHFLSSRATIRKAIESLKQRGYLYSVHGQGTFTLPARSRENHLLHSLTDDIKARDGVPVQNIPKVGYTPLSDIIKKNLELDIHVHTAFCVRHVRYMRNTPLGIQTSRLALNDEQEVTREELLAMGSLCILLEKKLATKPLETMEITSARLPSSLGRQLLKLTAGDVVLGCACVTLSVERKPMEYVEMVYPASRCSYKARITKDSFNV